MSGNDPELELFRTGVDCAVVLERMAAGWTLDRRGSTRRALKYRRGAGEIVIVNHDGRGWWDPQSTAKGDVFDLVQHLDPGLNFGQVRQVLRRFVGVPPSYPSIVRDRAGRGPPRPLQERWHRRPRLTPGSAAWCYLTATRALPAGVLTAADEQDAVREGYAGSAWFAHRDGVAISHIEVRGPAFKGSLTGGHKTLFCFFAGGRTRRRLAVAEAPIDALSLAAIEGMRPDTLYVATGGGMGPGTIAALAAAAQAMTCAPAPLLVSAADANQAGERFAARHREIAIAAGIAFERLRPPTGTDWNDVLTTRS